MTDDLDAEALRAAIVQRYGSVHRFCKQHKGRLCRSAVYMTLRRTYPGSPQAQLQKIKEALGLAMGFEAKVMEAIKARACARCSVAARPCSRCDDLFSDQAAAAMSILNSVELS